MLNVEVARRHFPALRTEWALFDNAGGSVAAIQVVERVHSYLERLMVQVGASYALSATATELVRAGQRAAADLVNAGPGEVVIGPSTTMNVLTLANALRHSFSPGDEIVVTDLDHEANIGAWRRLEKQSGVVIREWRLRADTLELREEDLEALLGARTRLVCFTHCSNLVGTVHDVAAITRLVHSAGARVCVDGVAYAPHRRVDVKALDVDYYLISLYKTYGPHLGLLYGKHELLREAESQNHFFLGSEPPDTLTPGYVNHELTAALPGILEYLDAIVADHASSETPAVTDRSSRLDRAFGLFAEHEQKLAARLLDFLASRRSVRVIGKASAGDGTRVPTISFVVDGRRSSEIPPLLEREHLAVRFGHFYAHRAVEALGLADRDGVVRVSMVHYNTLDEVERLIRALDAVI
jgi:cysteine desulfurase family protein (TIGR01976 family)